MNELTIFNSGQIRTVTINGEPYFVGKDVAEALGYVNSKNAVPKHVSDEELLSKALLVADRVIKSKEEKQLQKQEPLSLYQKQIVSYLSQIMLQEEINSLNSYVLIKF